MMAKLADGGTVLSLPRFQYEVVEWADRNFGSVPRHLPLLGMVEEIGELAHVVLKSSQGIRGMDDDQKRRAAEMDAIGDLVVFLANFCAKSGYSLEQCIEAAWAEVKQRDWTRDKQHGTSSTITGGD